MIDYNLDAAHSILYMQPKSALAAEDFVKIAAAVDPHIEATGGLAGVIIEVPKFTGWESFGALVAHFRLIRDHHKYVSKVAVVTDSTLVKLIESLASHFVAAEVRQFPWGETEVATQWILGGSTLPLVVS
ncbi:MAG: STAS/SEC14 domain-containing protein [Microcystis wesenbergii TW10]|jgi:hypothetical protein|uniref:STAS/SEC14 domain-containing protein n=3 Tax=Microcystis TaxID=1125 RepID=A0A552ATH0_MICAE|nr:MULTISPECIES: STAS/SEC14 domain-containing protein [Microcystis]REJ48260.1 MAG: STAS/SEC14 domain-containing protein [Microcystis wesenbergii TW10]TRT88730.1 MAG: STAS/SEC14 domain-containing protein [Microcystis aeruginosa Ma_OC_H_19870700_S124]MBD2116648.1 STAS/SEC14 domain-containing protein [Microcystis wesenbergii FACHB-1339]MCZ8037056.1 STAS/SEC14 domain-containing protein [Microcystis sp. LE17-20A]MCZ8212280.1 STAS/SEC14 domain-containing protein [Microcystis sp. LE19-8.1F]